MKKFTNEEKLIYWADKAQRLNNMLNLLSDIVNEGLTKEDAKILEDTKQYIYDERGRVLERYFAVAKSAKQDWSETLKFVSSLD